MAMHNLLGWAIDNKFTGIYKKNSVAKNSLVTTKWEQSCFTEVSSS